MEILNFGDKGASRKKRSNRALLAVAALLVGVVGSTYAASISINNAPIEYGQGVAQTTACDSTLVVAPSNTFVNATGAGGQFNLTGISIYDTNTTTSANGITACANKYLKVTAYGDSAATVLFQCDINLGAYTSTSLGFSTASATCGTPASTTAAFTAHSGTVKDGVNLALTMGSAVNAANIYKFTVESHV